MSIMILDLETETTGTRDGFSEPWNPDLYIVAAGWCVEDTYGEGEVQGLYFSSKAEGDAPWLTIPDDVDILVGHNIAFDLQWLLHRQPGPLWEFLRRGGMIFDTALAEFLLSGMTEMYPKLTDTAPKYGGTQKVDAVKLLWEQGVKTSAIPKDVLYDEYLIGPEGDIENTRKVFWGQIEALQGKNLWENAMGRMGGLLWNVLCMFNGLHVDPDIAAEHMKKLEAEQAELKAFYEKALFEAAGVGDFSTFKVTAFTLSSIIYGGYYKYEGEEPYLNRDGSQRWEKDCVVRFKDGSQVLVDAVPEELPDTLDELGIQSDAEPVRVASGKNKGKIRVDKVDSDRPAMKKAEFVVQLKGILPFHKLTKEMQETLLNHDSTRTFADGSKVLPTGREFLEALCAQPGADKGVQRLLKALVRTSEIDKDLGTYYLRRTPSGTSGMLQYLQADNIIHHLLNVTGTATGRLSSSRPNAQNIPRGDTAYVKQVFTSRFNDPVWLKAHKDEIGEEVYADCLAGCVEGNPRGRVIEIDYSALEVVTLAALSRDKNLIKALKEGTDMHCMRLAKQLGEPYEEVLKKCKDETHPQHKEYKVMRTNVKPKSFAFQYGATAYGIAFSTGCSVEEAEAFIAAEKELFPGVESWYEQQVFAQVFKSKRYESREYDDGPRAVGIGNFVADSGTVYTFQKYPKDVWVDGQRVTRMEFKPTQMRNYPIQGESSFFVQVIAGLVLQAILKRKSWQGKVFPINQVHDALYFDCYEPLVQRVVKVVKPIMEAIPMVMKTYGYDLPVPFPVEAEAGADMFTKHHVEV